jgi:hypothetical protein
MCVIGRERSRRQSRCCHFTTIRREAVMGANHAGERKRKKLRNTKKILATQAKKAAKAK